MNTQAIQINNLDSKKKIFTPILWVHNFVEKEKTNALGITLIYIMVGTGIGSLTAALSVHNTVNVFILMLSVSLAMTTNAAVLSQQSFKTTTWLFIISIIANIIMLIYQINALV
jgi:predicted nucleic acid binding AN1-type Zn finger protein